MEVGYDNERRAVERTPCFLAARYTCPGNYFSELGCEDVSPKGAKVFSLHPLKVNSYLKFDITTKKRHLMPVEGKICWSKKAIHGWHAGIAFNKDLPFDVRKII